MKENKFIFTDKVFMGFHYFNVALFETDILQFFLYVKKSHNMSLLRYSRTKTIHFITIIGLFIVLLRYITIKIVLIKSKNRAVHVNHVRYLKK